MKKRREGSKPKSKQGSRRKGRAGNGCKISEAESWERAKGTAKGATKRGEGRNDTRGEGKHERRNAKQIALFEEETSDRPRL
eukprot:4863589-Pleurochrysis_carterae.AAC.1